MLPDILVKTWVLFTLLLFCISNYFETLGAGIRQVSTAMIGRSQLVPFHLENGSEESG